MQDLLLQGSLATIHRAVLEKEVSVREIAKWLIDRIEKNSSLARLNTVRVLSPHARHRPERIAP